MVDQLVGWSTKTVGQGYGGGFFYSQFKELGIIRDLDNKIENWTYTGLDEVNKAATLVKDKMKINGII